MKVEISEIFMSLEGEAVHTGLPTVYIRFARCNKKCPLWNNHNKEMSNTGYATLTFDPKEYKSLKDLPPIEMGCDSQYSVNPIFSHLWKRYEAQELIQDTLNTIPHKSWVHPVTHQPVILSFTGGEPTTRLKPIAHEILPHPLMEECKHILFETNCSSPLRQADIDKLYEWVEGADDRMITWCNSPKLSDSGEVWKKSIMPSVALAQRNHPFVEKYPHRFTQYFKFVTDGSPENLAEVKKAMSEYHAAGIPENTEVALMPAACTTEQQEERMVAIADLCIKEGYRFSIRLQNVLWGNEIGT